MSRHKGTRLPSLTSLESIKEALDVRLGRRGDPLDRAVTMRDVIDSGLPVKAVRRGGPNDFWLEYEPPPERLVPPAPQNLVALAIFGGIHILWDSPGAIAPQVTSEISRSTSSDPETRQVLTYAGGISYLDMIDGKDATEYFYWVRFLSNSGHYGPYAGPVAQTTLPLVSDVMERLTGQIDESHLAGSLAGEIERIGGIEQLVIGPEALDGSVAQRIAAERAARITADDREAQERYDAIVAEQQARVDAITAEAAAREHAVSAETADRIADVAAERDARVLAIQEEQGVRAAAITAEEEARTTADEALGSRIDSLTVAVGDNSADITAEQQARADGDSALATDISALQVSVGDNEAAILNESEARATDLGLIAKQLDAVSASYRTNASTIYTLEEVRISDREATATRIDGLEVRVDDNEALVFREQQARADADSALATSISVLSAKIDSLPTYSNSFETGAQYDRWVADADHSIRPENTDAYVGESAAVAGSTAVSVDTTSPPFALAVQIPSGSAGAFLARRLRLSLAAKAPATGASSEFAIGYAAGDWFSGWERFVPAASWEIVEALVDVPEDAIGDHYFVIWADTSGAGGEVLVDRALVEVAEAAIPEITAQITAEQQARADGDAALSAQITSALSRVNDNEAAIISEAETRAAKDTALASDITTLSARVGDNEAGIVDEASARASADDAAALRIDGVVADVADNAAAISTEQTARANADTALGQQITAVDARVDESRSLITQETTARSTADSALAEDIQTLTATTGGLAADILSESTARADADTALAQDVTDLWAGVGDNEARVTEEASARASEDNLLAMVQQVVAAKNSVSSATIYTLEEVRLDAEVAMATRIEGMQAVFDEAQAAFEEEQTVRVSADAALATQISTVQSSLGDDIAIVQSNLNSEVTRLDGRVDANAQALTTAQSALGSDIATVQSDLNSEVTRLDGRVDANAQALTTAQSALGDDIASVQTSLVTEVSRVDGELVALGAEYTAKVQANGLIGGFGVYNDGTMVDAAFDVDRFWIGRTNSEKRKPFIIEDGTTYIDAAMIREAAIQEAQIGPLTIGKLKKADGTPVTTAAGLIRADAIDVGNLAVAEAAVFTGNVSSNNYRPGVSGWVLLQNGYAEFNEATIRGNLEVQSITVNGFSPLGGDVLHVSPQSTRNDGYIGNTTSWRTMIDNSWTRSTSVSFPSVPANAKYRFIFTRNGSAMVQGASQYLEAILAGDLRVRSNFEHRNALARIRYQVTVDGVTAYDYTNEVTRDFQSGGFSITAPARPNVTVDYTVPSFRTTSTVRLTVTVTLRLQSRKPNKRYGDKHFEESRQAGIWEFTTPSDQGSVQLSRIG